MDLTIILYSLNRMFFYFSKNQYNKKAFPDEGKALLM